MIPSFLRSLAAQVRALVQSGRSVHVTDADAAELELIAGLDWDRAPMPVLSGVSTQIPGSSVFNRDITARKIRLSDIAFGWLKCSLAAVAESSEIRFDAQCERAAICAELAVLCLGMHADQYYDGPRPCTPYQGTIEGARVAWAFMVEQLAAQPQRIQISMPHWQRIERDDQVLALAWKDVADKYRRELEGMR